jgi:non-ribosomal peptide synthase protein (TIGR01720 family)
MVRESTGRVQSSRSVRPHLLDVGARVLGGRLEASFTFSEGVHQRATVQTLAEDFVDALRSVIEHCTAPGVGGYTPADFRERISQATLDKLADQELEAEDPDE